jgi:hypothetical protein
MMAFRLVASVAALVATASCALAWSDTMDRSVRRRQSVMIAQFSLLTEFCRAGAIGRIGIDPAPRLGTVRFETGTSTHNPACPGVPIPYTRAIYAAGKAAGQDVFTLWVSNGDVLEPVKVTIDIR